MRLAGEPGVAGSTVRLCTEVVALDPSNQKNPTPLTLKGILAQVRLAGALASLAGVGLYNFALKDVPLRKMFLWTAVVGTGLGMTQVLLITGGPPFSSSPKLLVQFQN